MESCNCYWPPPPLDLNLSEHEIHVWCFHLERPAQSVAASANLLDLDERARANRFHFERDRWRFIVARGVLRQLSSACVRIPSERLQFRYSPRGKPALAEAGGGMGCSLIYLIRMS